MNKTIKNYIKDIEETYWVKVTHPSVSTMWNPICGYTTSRIEQFDTILTHDTYDGIIKALKNDT